MRQPNKPGLLIAAAIAVTSARVGLWVLPFGTLRRLTNSLSRAARPRAGADPAKVCRTIMIASRFIPRATCLTQALAAQVLLGRLGCKSQLRIGVGKPSDGFRAHAWVENESGEILIGHTDRSQFVLLPSIDGAAAA